MKRSAALAAAIVAVSMLGVASLTTAASAAKRPATVKVTLLEFKIKLRPKIVPAGKVRIVAKNIGTEKHEFVVARVVDPASLVTKADGTVDESQIAAADKMGEIEGVKPKRTKTKVFTLAPGTYIVFCNLVDKEPDGTKLSHYAQGMSTILTVT